MDENSGAPAVDPSEEQGPGEDLDPSTAGLAAVTLELARELAGEDLPRARWFALMGTASLLASQPAFASLLDEATIAQAEGDPHHLTAVDIDAPDGADRDPLETLARITWPDIASGAATVVDLDASRWAERAPGGDASVTGTGTLRVVAAAREDGTTWCAVRTPCSARWNLGARLVPDLVAALAQSIASA